MIVIIIIVCTTFYTFDYIPMYATEIKPIPCIQILQVYSNTNIFNKTTTRLPDYPTYFIKRTWTVLLCN